MDKDTRQTLSDRGALVESFCNAQTALYNSMLSPSAATVPTMHEYYEALTRVQESSQAMKDHLKQPGDEMMTQHVERICRVLRSAAWVPSPSGFPSVTQPRSMLTPVAVLRASIKWTED